MWLSSVQRTVTFWRSYSIRKLPWIFYSNSIIFIIFFIFITFIIFLTVIIIFFAQSQVWFMIELAFKKSLSHLIQMSITSNLEQSELLVYWIWALNIQKKATEEGSVTSPRNRFPIHFSNYWWAGISNYVYSIILGITKIYIFVLLLFTSWLLLIMQSQPATIA